MAVCDVRSAWNGSGGSNGGSQQQSQFVGATGKQLFFPLGSASPWSAVQE